jgi:DNA excision repair protein ERCC-4
VERKTVEDLVGCCTGDNRQRFERELHLLRGYRFKRLLIVGAESDILEGRYFSNLNSKSVLSTLYAFEVRYDVPIVFAPSPLAAARQVERWAFYFSREAVAAVNDLWRSTRPESAPLSP